MARTRNVNTPALSDVVRSIGWVLLSSIAGAAVLLAQARGDPTAQQPSKLVGQINFYSNANCEGRPIMIEFDLELALAVPYGRYACNSSVVDTADAGRNCSRWSETTSYNATCSKNVKTDWEMPVPGYMCQIVYADRQCGKNSSTIYAVRCYTMEGFGTIQPTWNAPPSASWSLLPVPLCAGTNASTMVLARNEMATSPYNVSTPCTEMYPWLITKNGECTWSGRYVW